MAVCERDHRDLRDQLNQMELVGFLKVSRIDDSWSSVASTKRLVRIGVEDLCEESENVCLVG